MYDPLNAKFSTKNVLGAFDRIFESVDSGTKGRVNDDEACTMFERAAEELKGKTLLVTKAGLMGIGVGPVLDGDLALLSPDANVPLEVRYQERPLDDHAGGQYRLVGTAYLDGVTEPLSVNEQIVLETEQLPLAEFRIW